MASAALSGLSKAELVEQVEKARSRYEAEVRRNETQSARALVLLKSKDNELERLRRSSVVVKQLGRPAVAAAAEAIAVAEEGSARIGSSMAVELAELRATVTTQRKRIEEMRRDSEKKQEDVDAALLKEELAKASRLIEDDGDDKPKAPPPPQSAVKRKSTNHPVSLQKATAELEATRTELTACRNRAAAAATAAKARIASARREAAARQAENEAIRIEASRLDANLARTAAAWAADAERLRSAARGKAAVATAATDTLAAVKGDASEAVARLEERLADAHSTIRSLQARSPSPPPSSVDEMSPLKKERGFLVTEVDDSAEEPPPPPPRPRLVVTAATAPQRNRRADATDTSLRERGALRELAIARREIESMKCEIDDLRDSRTAAVVSAPVLSFEELFPPPPVTIDEEACRMSIAAEAAAAIRERDDQLRATRASLDATLASDAHDALGRRVASLTAQLHDEIGARGRLERRAARFEEALAASEVRAEGAERCRVALCAALAAHSAAELAWRRQKAESSAESANLRRRLAAAEREAAVRAAVAADAREAVETERAYHETPSSYSHMSWSETNAIESPELRACAAAVASAAAANLEQLERFERWKAEMRRETDRLRTSVDNGKSEIDRRDARLAVVNSRLAEAEQRRESERDRAAAAELAAVEARAREEAKSRNWREAVLDPALALEKPDQALASALIETRAVVESLEARLEIAEIRADRRLPSEMLSESSAKTSKPSAPKSALSAEALDALRSVLLTVRNGEISTASANSTPKKTRRPRTSGRCEMCLKLRAKIEEIRERKPLQLDGSAQTVTPECSDAATGPDEDEDFTIPLMENRLRIAPRSMDEVEITSSWNSRECAAITGTIIPVVRVDAGTTTEIAFHDHDPARMSLDAETVTDPVEFPKTVNVATTTELDEAKELLDASTATEVQKCADVATATSDAAAVVGRACFRHADGEQQSHLIRELHFALVNTKSRLEREITARKVAEAKTNEYASDARNANASLLVQQSTMEEGRVALNRDRAAFEIRSRSLREKIELATKNLMAKARNYHRHLMPKKVQQSLTTSERIGETAFSSPDTLRLDRRQFAKSLLVKDNAFDSDSWSSLEALFSTLEMALDAIVGASMDTGNETERLRELTAALTIQVRTLKRRVEQGEGRIQSADEELAATSDRAETLEQQLREASRKAARSDKKLSSAANLLKTDKENSPRQQAKRRVHEDEVEENSAKTIKGLREESKRRARALAAAYTALEHQKEKTKEAELRAETAETKANRSRPKDDNASRARALSVALEEERNNVRTAIQRAEEAEARCARASARAAALSNTLKQSREDTLAKLRNVPAAPPKAAESSEEKQERLRQRELVTALRRRLAEAEASGSAHVAAKEEAEGRIVRLKSATARSESALRVTRDQLTAVRAEFEAHKIDADAKLRDAKARIDKVGRDGASKTAQAARDFDDLAAAVRNVAVDFAKGLARARQRVRDSSATHDQIGGLVAASVLDMSPPEMADLLSSLDTGESYIRYRKDGAISPAKQVSPREQHPPEVRDTLRQVDIAFGPPFDRDKLSDTFRGLLEERLDQERSLYRAATGAAGERSPSSRFAS